MGRGGVGHVTGKGGGRNSKSIIRNCIERQTAFHLFKE